jgi:hypothetical protein
VLIEFASLVLGSILNVLGEPFVEFIMGIKQTRHDEVQQRPEFCCNKSSQLNNLSMMVSLTLHGILDRSAG